MDKLFAALIPVLCVVALGPLFCSNMGAAADGTSACETPDAGAGSTRREGHLCEVTQ
jgi:hypothetical protein